MKFLEPQLLRNRIDQFHGTIDRVVLFPRRSRSPVSWKVKRQPSSGPQGPSARCCDHPGSRSPILRLSHRQPPDMPLVEPTSMSSPCACRSSIVAWLVTGLVARPRLRLFSVSSRERLQDRCWAALRDLATGTRPEAPRRPHPARHSDIESLRAFDRGRGLAGRRAVDRACA
jgi:hypothetical protein